jgi:hypothetical protein
MYGQNNCNGQSNNPTGNQRINQATNYLANQLSKNNISELTADEITYIQTYLEQVKNQKTTPPPVQLPHNKNPTCTNSKQLQQEKIYNSRFQADVNRVPVTATRFGRKSVNNDYYNPYEYGSKQNSLPSYREGCGLSQASNLNNESSVSRTPCAYEQTVNMYDSMGLTTNMTAEKFPGYVRNVNIESALIQQEHTHLPGQRANISSNEQNRFELLPFDPQDPTHIVWTDGMPRGGYPSRNDRLELS